MSVLELKEDGPPEQSRAASGDGMAMASLSKEQQDIESPEWHGVVLAARQAKVDSGEAQFLTVDRLEIASAVEANL